jgi:hypothetical protein
MSKQKVPPPLPEWATALRKWCVDYAVAQFPVRLEFVGDSGFRIDENKYEREAVLEVCRLWTERVADIKLRTLERRAGYIDHGPHTDGIVATCDELTEESES